MATSNNQFRLRLNSNTAYNFTVYWGDGTYDVFNGTTPVYQGGAGNSSTWSTQISAISASWPGITHTYAAPGNYEVRVLENVPGGFPGLQYRGVDDEGSNAWNPADEFNNDAKKLTKITNWGTVKWDPKKVMNNTFEGCINLKDVATDGGTSTLSALSGFQQAWYNCTSLSSFDVIDTSKGIDFANAWTNCTSLKTFPEIDTSKGTNFIGTWNNCASLSSFPLIDTSKGTNFIAAWTFCSSLSSFPLVNTLSATSLRQTWRGCSKLKSFPSIDTKNVTDFLETWSDCASLTSFPLINTSKATDFGLNLSLNKGAWYGCASLSSFPSIDTSNVKNFVNAWAFCSSLTSFPLIDTSRGTNFGGTWRGCSKLNSFPLINTLSGVDFSLTWQDCTSLSSFPLIDTSNCSDFTYAWKNCSSLSASDFPTLDMSKMTAGVNCFQGTKLTTTSYSALLTSLSATNVNTGVTFHGGNSTFNTAGSAAKVFLTTSIANGGRGWTINDGGYEPGT
jgi:hypothetical protein